MTAHTVPLPGTLADLLAVGVHVTADTPWLHTEFDPAQWHTPAGIVHSISTDHVGVVTVGVKGRPDGMTLDTIPLDRIHDCESDACIHRPRLETAANVRYAGGWCLRVAGRGTGRITDWDRRLIHVGIALLGGGL